MLMRQPREPTRGMRTRPETLLSEMELFLVNFSSQVRAFYCHTILALAMSVMIDYLREEKQNPVQGHQLREPGLKNHFSI